jgi:hypothetical protein
VDHGAEIKKLLSCGSKWLDMVQNASIMICRRSKMIVVNQIALLV